MKTNNLIQILLTVSGIGVVAFILWKILAPSGTAKTSATANPGTASPFSALYNGFGKLFGGKPQTDNTGALITASGNAFTSAVSGLKSIFGTPVKSPVATASGGSAVGSQYAFDPANPGTDYLNSSSTPSSQLTDSQLLYGVNLEAPALPATDGF